MSWLQSHQSVKSFCALILASLAITHPVQACDVELVLAMDVSKSVDDEEYRLMRDGTAAAFRTGDVIDLIAGMPGGIMATATQWGADLQQSQSIPWRHLSDATSVLSFAAEIDTIKRVHSFDFTAPAEALLHADAISQHNPVTCRRRVIDISGDGIGNRGVAAGPVASSIARSGVTINALVVRGADPDPLPYYESELVRGPLAFVIVADGFEDYPRAILRKLLRELSPSLAWSSAR